MRDSDTQKGFDMGEELVSIIIPSYGRSVSLHRAIDSVLQQSYENVEILVVDDNGVGTEHGNATCKLMQAYLTNPRIKYLQHQVNKNGSAARNTGFRASSGNFIMFLDDDDEFTPDKIRIQLATLKDRDDSWGAVYSGYVRKKNGKIIVRSKEKREGALLVEELKRNLFVHAGSNLMVRRHVVQELGGFDESFHRNQDVEFLCRILKKYKLAYADIVGLIVNIGEDKKKNIDFEELTNQFVEKFRPMIESLSLEDQAEVYRMLNLQRLRWHAMKSKSLFRTIAYKRELNLGLMDVLKYAAHLMARKISGTAYGFRR